MKVNARIGEIVDITAADDTTLATIKIEGIVDGCVQLDLDIPERSNVEIIEADEVEALEECLSEIDCPVCGHQGGGSPIMPDARGRIRSHQIGDIDMPFSDN